MTEISPAQRQTILIAAAAFTVESWDARAVTRNAGPLLAWAETAADASDARARVGAIMQQGIRTANRSDNPDAFLAQAGILYDFATAGSQS